MRMRLRRRPIRVRAGRGEIYSVSDDEMRIHICRPGRYNRYKHGIMRGIGDLASDYHLHLIEDVVGGTFVDCGANVGELGIWAQSQDMRYLAFEPEHLEAECCDLNNFSGQALTIRKALWKENTTLKFYHKASTADSSAFMVNNYTATTDIPAARLDDVVDISELTRPIIIKVEAEGAEPEVLEGAARFLSAVDYVTVDCGHERGPQQDHTFVEVHGALSAAGFAVVAARLRGRVTVLFERQGPPA